MTLYHVLITGLWISCCYSQTISGPLSVSLNPPNLDHVIWERSTFTVQCTAICSPNPCTFSWTKDGVEVSNTSLLFLGSMNKEKTGKYVCTARNTVSGATNISGTLMIEVYYGPDFRPITLNPSNLLYTILEGQTLANITCSADCNPVCSFIWRKSGIMVSNTGVLPLGSVTRNHAGSYECTANNEHIGRSASSWPVVIKIIYGPDSATLSPSALFYSTTEGNTISDKTCSATCLPDKCSFSWTKSGTEVSNSSVLSLGYAQRNMAGNYVCTAKNPGSLYNISTGTFVLEIAYGPENITLSPVIKSYTLNEGQILNNITCSAKCVPECTFSWKRSYTVMMNNNVLSVGSVKRGDTGIYECSVSNPKSGKIVNSYTVEIVIRYGPDSTVISPSSLYYSTTEGSTMSDITCSATCYPDKCSFSWTKSGNEVSNSSVLSLGSAHRNQAGNYVCTAKNPGTIETASSAIIVVEIAYGPEDITLSPDIKSYTFNEGQTLHNITCSAKCVPECTFSWKRSSTVIINSNLLSLGYVKRGDTGIYECSARNPRSGQIVNSQTVEILIRYGPDMVTLSPNQLSFTNNEGQLMSDIRCSASCVPVCTYIWRKSDILVSDNNVLSLGSLNRGEDGSYACTATNPELNVTTESPIVVIEIRIGPDSVSLSPPTLNYQMTEGQVLDNITCSARCVPDACLYTWSKSGAVIVNGFVLSIGSFEFGEAGSYVCTAKNPGSGVAVTSHSVLIESKEAATTLTDPETRQQTTTIIVGAVMGGCVAIVLVVLLMLRRRHVICKCNCVKTDSSPDGIDLPDTPSKTRTTDQSEQHTQMSEIENTQHTYEQIGRNI